MEAIVPGCRLNVHTMQQVADLPLRAKLAPPKPPSWSGGVVHTGARAKFDTSAIAQATGPYIIQLCANFASAATPLRGCTSTCCNLLQLRAQLVFNSKHAACID